MKSIWKFQMEVTGRQELMLPAGSIPLTCQLQAEQLCLWAICDTDSSLPREKFVFWIFGTGHPLLEMLPGMYMGTVQLSGGSLVFHIFLEQNGQR